MRSRVGLIFLAVLAACANGPRILEDQTLVRRISGQETHLYKVWGEPGQYIGIYLDQKGSVDMTFTVLNPDNELLLARDRPHQIYGREEAVWRVTFQGWYQIRVRPYHLNANGDYSIRLERGQDSPVWRASEKATSLEQTAEHHIDADRRDSAFDSLLEASVAYSEISSWSNAAFCRWRLADLAPTPALADELRQTAAHLFEHAEETLLAALVHRERGQIAFDQGRLAASIQAYKKAITKWPPDHPHAWRVAIEMGAAYLVAGLWFESEDILNLARTKCSEIGDTLGESRALAQLSWLAYLQDDQETALSLIQKARHHIKGMNASDEIGFMDRTATLLRDQRKPQEALALYRRALAQAPDNYRPDWISDLHYNIAETYLTINDAESALEYVRRGFEYTDLTRPQDIHGLYLEARALEAQDDIIQAEQLMEKVLQRSNAVRASSPQLDLQARYTATRRLYLDFYIDLLMKQAVYKNNHQKALEALARIEDERARRLEETLSRGRSLASAGPEIGLTLNRLRGLLPGQEPICTPALDKSKTIDALMRRLDWWWSRQELSLAKDLINPQNIPPEPLIDEDEAILYYAMGRTRVWLWVLSQDGLTYHDLGPRMHLEEMSLELVSFSQHRSPTQYTERIRKLAERLGEMLLPLKTPKRLQVIEDGALVYLPFSLLRIQDRWAGEIKTLTRSHSLGVRRRLQQRLDQNRNNDGMVIFANPAYEPSLGLSDLPGAEAEGRAIAERYGDQAKLYLGAEAHRTRLKSDEVQNARYLHIATHGSLHPQRGELSSLILAAKQEDDTKGVVYAFEVSQWNINADLVVLSACETALGEYLGGEGLIGLPVSLLEAGSGGVVVGMWRVDDEATRVFMEHFYYALLTEKQSPAQALQTARRNMIDTPEWSEPFYWAGFVYIGGEKSSD